MPARRTADRQHGNARFSQSLAIFFEPGAEIRRRRKKARSAEFRGLEPLYFGVR
jgi:hypothetical protein